MGNGNKIKILVLPLGFNFLRDSVAQALKGEQAKRCLSLA
jgi:hypothetical protein